MIPRNPYSHFYLGKALEALGCLDEARDAYAEAVANAGTSPNPAFNQALRLCDETTDLERRIDANQPASDWRNEGGACPLPQVAETMSAANNQDQNMQDSVAAFRWHNLLRGTKLIHTG